MLKNLILAAVMVLVALPAQAGDCPKMKAHKEEMQKFLTADLGLDADKAGKVSAVLHDSFMKKKKAEAEKEEAFEALAKLVEANEADVGVYEAALKKVHEAKDGYMAAKKAKCDALGNLLDAKQIAFLKVHMHKAHDGHKGHHGHKGCKGDCKGDGSCKGDCKGKKGCDCKGDCKGKKGCDCKGDCKGDCKKKGCDCKGDCGCKGDK